MNPQFWKGILIFQFIMLLMLAASVPFNEPGTATYVIIQLAAIHVVAGIILVSILLYSDWDPFRALR